MSNQWWGQFNIFIYIFSLVVNFSFEFNNHRLHTGLIKSGSVEFLYIGFQFFVGYSSLFQFVNDGFCLVLHIIIFFLFFTRDTMRHNLRGYASKSSAFFIQRFFFSKTANLPKILYTLETCWLFLLIFQLSYAVF